MANVFKVASDNWTFVRSETGEPFVPYGTNYYDPATGWPPHLWSGFSVKESRSHFELMNRLGVNIVRFHLSYPTFYSRNRVVSKAGIEKLLQLLELCREFGIAALVTGLVYYEGPPAWDTSDYFVEERILDALCFFWREFAGQLKDYDAIFAYDIYNEPSLPWDSPILLERWRQHLRAKFGDEGEMGRRLNLARKVTAFEDVEIPHEDDESQPTLRFEYQMFQEELGFIWTKAQVEAIRSADDRHMVTVGSNPWSMYGLPKVDRGYGTCRGFNSHFLAPLLDFLSVHFYPIPFFTMGIGPDPISTQEGRRLAARLCEALCRMSHEGKPVLLEEFGWYGGGTPRWEGLLDELPFKSEEEQATYCGNLVEASKDWCSGSIYWSLGDTPASNDISQFSGLVDARGRLKRWGTRFAQLAQSLQQCARSRRTGLHRETIDLFRLYTSPDYERELWLPYLDARTREDVPDFEVALPGWEEGRWAGR
jgi:hypothetical protein